MMEESATSESFEPEMSTTPASPSPDSAMEDAEVSGRTGVESREEVLRQMREDGWEIIEIDPDPATMSSRTHGLQSHQPTDSTLQTQHTQTLPLNQKRTRDTEQDVHTQPAKQRKMSDGINPFTSSTRAEGHQSSLGSTPTSSTNVSVPQDHAARHKKSLWCSSKAKENMLRISSLPSPESTSSDLSIESKSPWHEDERRSNLFGSPSWSFEDIGEPSKVTTYNFDSTMYGSHTDIEPAIENPSHSLSSQSVGAIFDPLQDRRKNFEQSGIADSQRLRTQHHIQKKRPTLIKNPGASSRAHPVDASIIAPRNSGRLDAALSDQQMRLSDIDEDDPAKLEQYFDLLMDHEQSQRGLLATNVDRRQDLRPGKKQSVLPSPYSRDAAEKWRTQSRHLHPSNPAAATLSSVPASEPEVLSVYDDDEDDDETRIAQVRAGAYQTKAAKRDREAEKRLLSKKFYAPDLEDRSKKTKSSSKLIAKPKPLVRTRAEIQSDLRKLMGTVVSISLHHKGGSDELENNPDAQNEHHGGITQRSLPIPTVSALSQLDSDTKKAGVISNFEEVDLEEVINDLPEQGSLLDLKLPMHFHRYTESDKKLYMERETKKERQKDLDMIRAVFTLGAQLGSLDALDTNDPKQLSQLTWIKRFTEAVLEHQKSGKPMRERIRSIRDAFKRRLDNVGKLADEDAADGCLRNLLQPELFDKLSSDSIEIKQRLTALKSEIHRINNYYHSKRDPRKNKSCAKVSFGTRDSTGKAIRSGVSAQSKFPTKKQKLAGLRAVLEQHEQNSQDPEDEVETIDLGPSRDYDDDGEVSEEDEGEDLMHPAGFEKQSRSAMSSEELSLEEVNRLENDRQRAQAHTVLNAQPSQGVNQQLLNSMLAKRQQQDHLMSQGVQKSDLQVALTNRQRRNISTASVKDQAVSVAAAEPEDFDEVANYDIDQESSQEFDDSDIDVEDDDADDEHDGFEPVCRRYIARGICHGVSKALDQDEHLLGNYLNKEAARKKVSEFTNWIKQQALKYHPELETGTFNESTSETKGSLEQKVVFGDNEDVVCRAWFIEELYNPSEEAYQKAKVYRACQPTPLWFVTWERTITPSEESEKDEKSGDETMTKAESSNIPGNENSSGEDSSEPENLGAEQTIQPEGGHGVDVEHHSTEVSQADDDLSNPESPINSSVSSSAVTLVSDVEENTKDCLMPEADVNVKINVDNDNAAVEEEKDDLFSGEVDMSDLSTDGAVRSSPEASPGPEPRRPSAEPDNTSTSRQSTTTHPTHDQLRFFTTRSLANRHAKNVFMQWYIECLTDTEDWEHIAATDELMEENLRQMGDRSCWGRDEDANRFEENASGGMAMVKDRLHVWVYEGKMHGPRN